MILIPVKNLATAKQRLARLFDQATRTQLAKAMLQDVLQVLSSWSARPAVSLVTNDPFALELARHFDFEVIPDHENRGETKAIEMATRQCEERGIDSTLVMPGDIPLIEVWELEEIMEAAPEEGSLLVPAADGRGSNAVFRRPAGLFPLRFGNDSFQPHLAAARATGKPCVILPLPRIALDIDNPADLRQLADAPGETRSQGLIRQWDLSELLLAANE
jgi:2-phospho-L-lactate/phosphoenolpyruvate guanylyltransferase